MENFLEDMEIRLKDMVKEYSDLHTTGNRDEVWWMEARIVELEEVIRLLKQHLGVM